jgi:CTP synthase (UTP-ammonia lyase)
MKIAIVGDYRPGNETHRAVTEGLTIAGAEIEWVRSDEVDGTAERLAVYGGVVAAPGSPYANMEGALAAIRHARERGCPSPAREVGSSTQSSRLRATSSGSRMPTTRKPIQRRSGS